MEASSECPMAPAPVTEIVVECSVCGSPLTLGFCPTGNKRIDDCMMNVARMTVHEQCYKDREKKISDTEENMRVARRAADWRLLCPPMYQNSREWLLEHGNPYLNLRAIQEASEWVYGSKGLLMQGKASGTGKTTSGWLICQREYTAGRFVMAMTHKELADKATWFARELTLEARKWTDTIRRCDLVFIDDLGKTRFRGVNGDGRASEEFLFDLVDNRIKNQLPTIFTVNMTGEEMKREMSSDKGEYFVRRLREFFTTVKFDTKI